MITRILTHAIVSTLAVATFLNRQPVRNDGDRRCSRTLGTVKIGLATLLFLTSRVVYGGDDGAGSSIEAEQLSTTQFGDGVREILCVHTAHEILAVVSVRVPKSSQSSESTSGVRREDAPSRHGTVWAEQRWGDEKLRIEWSTKLPNWIRVNGRRMKLSAGRVIYWDDRIMGQSDVLNGPLPRIVTSDPDSSKGLAALRKRVRAQFPTEATWDRIAGIRVSQQRQQAGKRWPLVKGTLVDAITGERIKKEISIQRGNWHGDMIRWSDHPNGSAITDHGDGTFEATLYQWTSRVVVDGYLPKVILEQLPHAEVDQLKCVLKLTPAPVASGRVLNHLGTPGCRCVDFCDWSHGFELAGRTRMASYRAATSQSGDTRSNQRRWSFSRSPNSIE